MIIPIMDLCGTISGVVNNIVNSNVIKYGSAVKSVQRGVATDVAGSEYITVTIGSVNPAKCLVIVDGFVRTGESTSGNVNYVPVFINSLTNDELTMEISSGQLPSSSILTNVSWQVIEYY